MRIAMIGQKGIPAIYGGIERHVEELSIRLVKRGFKVTVYNRPWFTDASKKYHGVDVVTLPSIHTKHLDTITHTLISTIHAIIKGVDIFHFHGVGPSLLSWMPRIFAPSARVVTTFHCIDRKHKKWGSFAKLALRTGEWAACKFAHKTIATSKVISCYSEAVYDCKPIHIPNGIPPVTIPNTDSNIKKEFGIKKNQYIIAVTRLIAHKGVHFLISAFRQLETKKKLVIVGSGHFTEDYVKLLHKLASGDERILFTGFQSGKILDELYANASLIVQPSEIEGFSISLLEAMNFGRPVLASDIDENKEALGEYGWYFQSGNSVDLKRQLKTLLKKPHSELMKRAKHAQIYVRNEFNWDKITDTTKQLYDSITEQKQNNKTKVTAQKTNTA